MHCWLLSDYDCWRGNTPSIGQDHWIAGPRLALDLGIGADSQELSESSCVAPRAGVAWNVSLSLGTVVRAGSDYSTIVFRMSAYAFDR